MAGRDPDAVPRWWSGCKASTMPSTCGSESLRFGRMPMRSMRPDCSSVDFTRDASDAGSLGPDPAFSPAPRGLRSGVADHGVDDVAKSPGGDGQAGTNPL